MTNQRAQEVLANEHPIWGIKFNHEHEFNMRGRSVCTERISEKGITREEDAYIRMIWSLMGGSTSYYDALVAIAQGFN